MQVPKILNYLHARKVSCWGLSRILTVVTELDCVYVVQTMNLKVDDPCKLGVLIQEGKELPTQISYERSRGKKKQNRVLH